MYHFSKKVTFSIGWNVDCRAMDCYTHGDVEQMKHFISKYNLISMTQGSSMEKYVCKLLFVYPDMFV